MPLTYPETSHGRFTLTRPGRGGWTPEKTDLAKFILEWLVMRVSQTIKYGLHISEDSVFAEQLQRNAKGYSPSIYESAFREPVIATMPPGRFKGNACILLPVDEDIIHWLHGIEGDYINRSSVVLKDILRINEKYFRKLQKMHLHLFPLGRVKREFAEDRCIDNLAIRKYLFFDHYGSRDFQKIVDAAFYALNNDPRSAQEKPVITVGDPWFKAKWS